MAKIYNSELTHQKGGLGPPQILPNPLSPRSSAKGLSNTLNLTARVYQNSECQLFSFQNGTHKDPKKGVDKRTNEDKKGDRIQKGLTGRGKKTIRIISACYQKLIDDKQFYDERHLKQGEYHQYTSFITLSFRNIIPTDKEAKKLLDSFLKRLRRKKDSEKRYDIHYIWVAERQKRGAIHFHLLTPEKISNNENSKIRRIEEITWVNRAWNETVLNWAKKSNKINDIESKQWKSELRLNENYNIQLSLKRAGQKANPIKPPKSEFLLLPNLIHTFHAGAYMSKYMSKENENIVGGMYGASTMSREFLVAKTRISKPMLSNIEANEIVMYIHTRLQQSGIFSAVYHIEFNDTYILWCKRPYKMMEFYFDYEAKYGFGLNSRHPKLNFRYKDESQDVTGQSRDSHGTSRDIPVTQRKETQCI